MGVCSPCYWNFRLCFAIVIFLAGPPSPFRSLSLSCLPLAVALLSASVMLRPSRLSWFGYPFSHSSSVSYFLILCFFMSPLLVVFHSLFLLFLVHSIPSPRLCPSPTSFSCSVYLPSPPSSVSLSFFHFPCVVFHSLISFRLFSL